jgi:hypothetical protein
MTVQVLSHQHSTSYILKYRMVYIPIPASEFPTQIIQIWLLTMENRF